MSRDLYKILGVSKNASDDEIKKAYRKLAMENHPDKHKNEKEKYEAKFKEINDAYTILSDKQKRSQYDQFGENGSPFGNSGGFQSNNGGFGANFDFGDINDIFSNFFGDTSSSKKRRQTTSKRGSDLKYKLAITLEEVFYGAKKTIEFKCLDKCTNCNGSGSGDNKKSEATCDMCKGNGAVRMQQGFFIVEQTCSKCKGSGTIINNPCKNCNSTGQKEKIKQVVVDIPQGIVDDCNIRIEGAGEAGERNGQNGDLYVEISVKKHKYFTRDNDNLLFTMPIRFAQATLGAKIEIITITKKTISFDIPKGTQSGQKFTIRGEGLPILHRESKKGDLILTVNIETPVNLTKEQETLLAKFDELMSPDAHPQSKGFFANLMDWFK